MPVMVLPLAADEAIDEAVLRREVDFAIAGGASSICAPGFASEFYKLTDEERRQVIRVVAEQSHGRVPMFASTGCGSVKATVELSQYAQSAGAAGLMVVAPKWVPLGAAEQKTYFEGVCRNVDLPVMLQDADFAGAGLSASLIVELADRCPNLKYAKLENVLAGGKCAEIVRLSQGRVQVLYGLAGITLLDGLAHGAIGVMPGPSFVKAYVRIFELYGSGQTEEAKAVFYRMQPYISFAMQHVEVVIQMEKLALVRQKVYASDRMREPTLHLDEPYQNQMEDLISLMLALCEKIEPQRVL